jgi:hypothetical protein
LQIFESATNLVAHGASDIVAGNLILLIDECFGPDFGVNFVLGVEVVANVILHLLNLVKLFLSVDVHSSDGLTQVGAALVFLELGVPHIL